MKHLAKTCASPSPPPPQGYVSEIYQAIVTISTKDLEQVANDLKEIVPGAMHTTLEKETKEDAIKKHLERKQSDLLPPPPPTCPGNEDLRRSLLF